MEPQQTRTIERRQRLEIYDRKAAARRLNLSVGKLDQIRRAGRIGFCREGRRVFYLEKHLMEFALSIETPKAA